MRFPIIRSLHAGAFLLLISAPVQAQLSAEAQRVPRTADIADLAFEPSDPLAGLATSLPEGHHLEYQLLDARGNILSAPAGPQPESTEAHRPTGAGLTLVTVPAGTFNCYPIASRSERGAIYRPGPRIKSGGRQVDYYDPAAGLVKTDYYDKNGKLLQSRVLSRR